MESLLLLTLFILIGGIFSLTSMMQRQRTHLRALDIKLDALLKQQGVEWPSLSPKAQALALEGNKIGAIQVHREEHPEIGLAEAKAEVEAFAAPKH